MPGKADWSASRLPKEGKLAGVPTIGEAARKDVSTCAPAEMLGEARDHTRKAGWGTSVVVNEDRIVLGLLGEKELASDPEAT